MLRYLDMGGFKKPLTFPEKGGKINNKTPLSGNKYD